MRKTTFLVVSTAVFSLTASAARAWDICIQDQLYTPQLQFNLEAPAGPEYLLRGQAILSSSTSFPAPMAGYLNVNTLVLSMTIGYKGTDASRHYVWFLGAPGAPAVTWGITPDATYYDDPRVTQFVGCPPATDVGREGETPSQLGNVLLSLPPAADVGQEGKTGTP